MARIDGQTGRNEQYWEYYLEVTEQDVSVQNNTSKVKVEVYLGATSYSRAVRGNISATHTITINGKDYEFETGAYTVEKNETIKLGQVISDAIGHNLDGSKTVSIWASSPDLAQASGYGPYSGEANGNVSLTTIPRASSFTVSGNTIGSVVNVSITRADNSFTHTVTLKFGNTTPKVNQNVGTSTSFNTTIAEYAPQIPNSMTGIATIIVDTYKGNTKIGSNLQNVSLNLPNTVKPGQPTVSLTESVSGISEKFGGYVQNKSKISGAVTADGIYGSNITGYNIQINRTTYNTRTFLTSPLYSSGQNSCVVTVTDSRGQTNTTTVYFNVLSYQEPAILKFTAVRNSNNQTQLDCIISTGITSLSGNNDHTIKIMLDNDATPKYQNTIDYTLSNTSVSISNVSESSAHTVKLVLTDYFCKGINAIVKEIPIGTAQVLMNWSEDGEHMAIGQVYDSSLPVDLQVRESFAVAGEKVFYKNNGNFAMAQAIMNLIYPVGSIYMSVNSTSPATLFGGTWTQLKDRFLLGAGDTYTNGATGGEATHTLTTSEIPALANVKQVEKLTNYGEWVQAPSGTAQPHNIMPPYLVVYMWKRTA